MTDYTDKQTLITADAMNDIDDHVHESPDIHFDDVPADGKKYNRKNKSWEEDVDIEDHGGLSGVTPDQHHNKSHSHDGADGSGTVAWLSLTDTPISFAGEAGKLVKVDPTGAFLIFGNPSGVSVGWGDILGSISAQTDLQAALDGKSDTTHLHDLAYSAIDHTHGSDYAAIDHTHGSDYAALVHSHPISEVSALQTELDKIGVNAAAISAHDTSIGANASAIAVNSGAVAANDAAIVVNANAVAANTNGIATNVADIITHGVAISGNADAIVLVQADADANEAAITAYGIVINGHTTALGGFKFLKKTQAQYDALTPDASTVYLIVG